MCCVYSNEGCHNLLGMVLYLGAAWLVWGFEGVRGRGGAKTVVKECDAFMRCLVLEL